MGNKTFKPYNSDNDETLTDYDKAIYNKKREKVFYGTIAICVLYASFAILLLIASYLSDKIKYILLSNFLPFTIVYIFGTIIIILYLIYQIYYFKPYKIDRNAKYDNLSCPDYWTLEKVNNDDVLFKNVFDSNSVNYSLFNYRCKLNSNIFYKKDIYTASSDNYYFTNLENTSNKPINTQIIDNNNNLYVNLLDTNKINDINEKIFKNNLNLKLKYELNKNTLLMNNYKIVGNENNSNSNYVIFERVFKNDNINKDIYKNKFSINYQNFDSDPTNDLLNKIDDKYIKIFKDTGNITASDTLDGQYTDIKHFPLICDSVYPMFLANTDENINKKDNNFDNNIFRCAYSKLCKVPWSDMNCDKYTP